MSFACPICGVGFAKAGSVRAHMTRKTDEEHKGVNGWDYEESELSAEGSAEPEGEVESPESAASEGSASGGGLGIPEGPAGATAEPTASDGGETSGESEPTCPECGGSQYFDATKAGYRYGCADCSTASDWVVYNG